MDFKVQLKNIVSSTTLENTPKDAIGFVLSNLAKENDNKIFLHITTGNFQSEILQKEIEFFAPDVKTLLFENWDNLPYDKSSPKNSIQSQRIQTLHKILNYSGNKKIVIITTINAVLQKIMPRGSLQKATLKLTTGQPLTLENVEEFLINTGYKKVSTTISTGEFAINNNVADIITAENKCYRVKFYNNKINEIRKFNPLSQTSFDNLTQIYLLPANEIIFAKEYISNFKQNYKILFGMPRAEDILYHTIAENKLYIGVEHFLPLFYNNKLETLFDYLPKETFISLDENIHEEKLAKLNLIEQHYQERVKNIKHSMRDGSIYNPLPPSLMYLTDKELNTNLAKFITIKFISKHSDKKDERAMDLGIKKVKDFYTESQEKGVNVFRELGLEMEKD